MTVTSTISSQTFPGTGAQTVFDFAFNIPATGDERVFLTDGSGNVTTLASTTYSINGYNSNSGGALTYPLVGSPLASSSTITIARDLPVVQDTVLENQGPYFPNAVEQALDYVTMLIQQTDSIQNRALQVPLVDPPPLPLPAVAQRALQLLGFDASGNPIAAQPSSATVSSAMAPVVAAATLAIARTLLGLGTMATEGIGAGLQDDGANNARVNFTTYDDATNQTVTSAFHLTRRDATGPITYALAKASTYWNGFGFWVSVVSGGPVTLTINAADSFVGQSAGASATVQRGQIAYISTDGAGSGAWYIDISGQAAASVIPINPQTGGSYTVQLSDWGKAVTRTYSASITDSLPQAVGSFGAGFWLYYQNTGATGATITPSTSTINGAASLFIPPQCGVLIVSDGTNYQTLGALPKGQRILLNTITASASYASDLTSFLSGCSEYEIVFEGLVPATNNNTIGFQCVTAGGGQSSSYSAVITTATASGVVAQNPAGNLYIPASAVGYVANSAPGVWGRIFVSNPQSTGKKVVNVHSGGISTTGTEFTASGSGWWDGGTDPWTGFSLLTVAGGNMAGTIKVYGYV